VFNEVKGDMHIIEEMEGKSYVNLNRLCLIMSSTVIVDPFRFYDLFLSPETAVYKNHYKLLSARNKNLFKPQFLTGVNITRWVLMVNEGLAGLYNELVEETEWVLNP